MRLFVLLIAALGLAVPAFAQQAGEQANQGGWIAAPRFDDPTDITRNPDDISNRLRQEAKRKDTLLETPGFDRSTRPWTDFKDRLYDDYGLGFGIFYTALYQKADARLVDFEGNAGPDEGSGGILGIAGTWELIGRGTNHPGMLGFRLNDRHRMGPIPPQSLGPDIGSLWLTGTLFNQFSMSLSELYWEQHIVKDHLAFRVGKTIPFTIHDYFKHKSPVSGFQDSNLSLNSSISWVGFALGATGLVRPTPDTYVAGGIYDAKGKENRAGFDEFFNDGEHFHIVDIGWDPGYLDPARKLKLGPIEVSDYHVTLWHKDAVESAMTPEGWGFTVFLEHRIGNVLPFFRYGYSEGTSAGNPALLDRMVTGGVAIENVFGQDNDVIGIGASWGRKDLGGIAVPISVPIIVDVGVVEQYSIELFYRVQVTQEFQVTPSVQFIVDPAFNLEEDTITVLGLRGRGEF